jgi:WD40 repeat protein
VVGLTGDHAVTLDNEKIRFWDLSLNGDARVSPAGSLRGNFRVLQLSLDGTKAFAASLSPSESGILDMTTRAFIQKMDPSQVGTVTAAAWSPDGRLALGHSDGKIEIWRDNVSQEVDAVLPKGPIDSLQFSGDGNSLVAVQQLDSANSGIAYVLRENRQFQDPLAPQNDQRAPSWISVRLAHADLDPILAAAISTDGKRVVTGSGRGRVTLWNSDSEVGTSGENTSSERELMTLHEFLSSVRFVTFGKHESSVVTFETVSPPGGSNNALIIPSQ